VHLEVDRDVVVRLDLVELPIRADPIADIEPEWLDGFDRFSNVLWAQAARQIKRNPTDSLMRRLICQSWRRPVPPSSLTADVRFPESNRMPSTNGATPVASVIDSSPLIWMTRTSETPGSASRNCS